MTKGIGADVNLANAAAWTAGNRCAFIPPLRGQKNGRFGRDDRKGNAIANGVCEVRNPSGAKLKAIAVGDAGNDRYSQRRRDFSLAPGMTLDQAAPCNLLPLSHSFMGEGAGRG